MNDTKRNPDVVIYAGPSLRPHDIERLNTEASARGCVLAWKPPVCRDDLVAMKCENPGTRRALILDGEFHQRLSVSVSEIRELLNTQKVDLHGASSMGALRAVECRSIGMVGHGWVYKQYLSGTTEADGDVALLYDPFDFAPVTIPLINIRWLVHQALNRGDLDRSIAENVYLSARSLHYTERSPGELAAKWERDLPDSALQVLLRELGDNSRDLWDRKRLDALDAVEQLSVAP